MQTFSIPPDMELLADSKFSVSSITIRKLKAKTNLHNAIEEYPKAK